MSGCHTNLEVVVVVVVVVVMPSDLFLHIAMS